MAEEMAVESGALQERCAFGVAYAFKGQSVVVRMGEDDKSQIRLLKPEGMESFLLKTLRRGDTVVTVMGGANDTFAMFAHAVGCDVWQIAPHQMGDRDAARAELMVAYDAAKAAQVESSLPAGGGAVEIKQAAKKGKQAAKRGAKSMNGKELKPPKSQEIHQYALEQIVKEAGIKLPAASATGKETGQKVAERKLQALAARVLFGLTPEAFREFQAPSVEAVEIRRAYMVYRRAQAAMMRQYQWFISERRATTLLEACKKRATDLEADVNLAELATNELIRFIETHVAEEARAEFRKTMGLERALAKGAVSLEKVEDLWRRLMDAMLEADLSTGPFMSSMRESRRTLETLLNESPVFQQALAPISGCGTLLGGGIMASVGDIRRFSSMDGFLTYCGLGHEPDGSIQRRHTGESAGCNTELKQLFWKLVQQIVKAKDSAEREILDRRRGYEILKLLREVEREAKAAEINLTGIELVPAAYAERVIWSYEELTIADFGAIYTRLNQLLVRLGFQVEVPTDEIAEGEEKPNGERVDAEAEDEDAPSVAKRELSSAEKALKKLLKGKRGHSFNRACRWMKQRLAKQIFKAWRRALGLVDVPVPRDWSATEKDPAHQQALAIKWDIVRGVQTATETVQKTPSLKNALKIEVETARVRFFSHTKENGNLPKESFFRLLKLKAKDGKPGGFAAAYQAFYAAINEEPPKHDEAAQ